MSVKLPFALKDGMLVEISSVERGSECGCICPACNKPLIARKKRDYEHNYTDHFAHKANVDCPHALETAFHYAAKEILLKRRIMRVPSVILQINKNSDDPFLIQGEQLISFDKVSLENSIGEVVPDVVVEIGNYRLMIEIYVTHRVDDIKKEKIRKLNLSTIEIDLKAFRETGTLADLEKEIIESTMNKQWIYNSTENDRKRKLKKHIKEKAIFKQWQGNCVQDCPVIGNKKNKMQASYKFHCSKCRFLYGVLKSRDETDLSIQCLGHANKEIDLIIRGIERWEQRSFPLEF